MKQLLLLLSLVYKAVHSDKAADKILPNFPTDVLRLECDEALLVNQAKELLSSHFDVEMGAVASGNIKNVGFQHLKTAEALMSAQAIAHYDFTQAIEQYKHVLSIQHENGWMPHMIYGPSVEKETKWFTSKKTYYPGPAFWKNQSFQAAGLKTTNVLAPPILADVAWQIFRLGPYQTALGVVGYDPMAINFLCHIYQPLKKFHEHLITTRADPSNKTDLLASHHPWETFSLHSTYWKNNLIKLKTEEDYEQILKELDIPQHVKDRFAQGYTSSYDAQTAISDVFEPLLYLSYKQEEDYTLLRVYDVEFNAFVLRSTEALLNIALILSDHVSSCPNFEKDHDDLKEDIRDIHGTMELLKEAILKSSTTSFQPHKRGFWNETAQFFQDDNEHEDSEGKWSLRGFLPAYAMELPEKVKTGVISHFLAPSESFSFLCDHFPISFFPCPPSDVLKNVSLVEEHKEARVTLLLYNYFVQRGFATNQFPGIAEFLRNKTRSMICASYSPLFSSNDKNTSIVFAQAYDSATAVPLLNFSDSSGVSSSSIAIAVLLNILLPSVTPSPSPDTPPIDHRMVTLIMCIELVVAFGVAIGCVVFSVYFVANRPEYQQGKKDLHVDKRKKSEYNLHPATISERNSSTVGRLEEEEELEEALLSEDEEHLYGSFEAVEGSGGATIAGRSRGASTYGWESFKDALSALSPWV